MSKRKKKVSTKGIAGYRKAIFGNKTVKSLKKRMVTIERAYKSALKKAKAVYKKKKK